MEMNLTQTNAYLNCCASVLCMAWHWKIILMISKPSNFEVKLFYLYFSLCTAEDIKK